MGDIKASDRFSATVEGYARYVNREGTFADVTLVLGQRELPVGSFPIIGVTKLPSPLKVGDKLTGSGNPEPPVGTLLHFDNENEIASRRDAGWYHVNQGPHPWRAIDHGMRTVIHVPES